MKAMVTGEIQAVCLLAQVRGGNVVMVSRKDDHNAWGLVGGKVESDEFPIDAIIRETKEETGIELDRDKLASFYLGDCNGWFTECFIYKERLDPFSPFINTEGALVKADHFVGICSELVSPFWEYNKQLHAKLVKLADSKLAEHYAENNHEQLYDLPKRGLIFDRPKRGLLGKLVGVVGGVIEDFLYDSMIKYRRMVKDIDAAIYAEDTRRMEALREKIIAGLEEDKREMEANNSEVKIPKPELITVDGSHDSFSALGNVLYALFNSPTNTLEQELSLLRTQVVWLFVFAINLKLASKIGSIREMEWHRRSNGLIDLIEVTDEGRIYLQINFKSGTIIGISFNYQDIPGIVHGVVLPNIFLLSATVDNGKEFSEVNRPIYFSTLVEYTDEIRTWTRQLVETGFLVEQRINACSSHWKEPTAISPRMVVLGVDVANQREYSVELSRPFLRNFINESKN